MAGLTRTDLTAPQKATLSASALTGKGQYGPVTALAQIFEVSRSTVYASGAEAEEVLTMYYQDHETNHHVVSIRVDDAQIERTVISLRCQGPNSIRTIQDILPVVYPGIALSYGAIQAICAKAETNAGTLNAKADLSGIKAGALDELFSQRQPVLGGVDLDTGYIFSLALRKSRAAKDWAEVLKTAKDQGLDLKLVVKDAAKGIAAGVTTIYPGAEQRDDCFHAQYEAGKVKRQLENKAYGAIAREEEAEKALEKLRSTGVGGSRRKLAAELNGARKRCQKAIAEYDQFDGAVSEMEEAMEFVDLDTAELRDADDVQRALVKAADNMLALEYENARKVGRYLKNRAPGLVMYMRELVGQLKALFPMHGEKEVRLAAYLWRLFRDLHYHRWPWSKDDDERRLIAGYARLQELAGDRASLVLLDTTKLILRRHRASSAIEGVNAGVRPFLDVHKSVTQGFLDLYRFYHNLKQRRWGLRKGTSPHELLFGEPAGDWLTRLGFPPSPALS